MILAIDTAGPVAGVAASVGDRLAVRIGRVPRGTEVVLARWIGEVCDELGRPVTEVAGIGVVAGPGAFTGLRVGLASASGLALALGVPVWTCDSLRPRAERAGTAGQLVVMLDARKSRVYASRWFDGVRSSPPEDVAPEAALAGLLPGFRAMGEGALVFRDLVASRGGVVVEDADDPGVDRLVVAAGEGLGRGEGVEATQVAPWYVREPDAVPTAQRG